MKNPEGFIGGPTGVFLNGFSNLVLTKLSQENLEHYSNVK
jgi:hypothetical protein